MTNRSIVTALIGALLMLASGTPTHADQKASALDRAFVKTVSQGNNAEIMTSRLALKKSHDKDVRMVADMLLKQHSQAEGALKKVAAACRLDAPAGTDPEHKALFRRLSRLSGPAFDKAFLTAQVHDHYMVLALFKKEMSNGTQSDVRDFAARFLPDIDNHTKVITNVAGNRGVEVAAPAGAKHGASIAAPSAGTQLAKGADATGTKSTAKTP